MFKRKNQYAQQHLCQFDELTLSAGQITGVTQYSQKEAIFFVISGQGKVFLQHLHESAVYTLEPYVSFSILPGYIIDLYNTSESELKLAVFYMPTHDNLPIPSLGESHEHTWEVYQNPYFQARFKMLDIPRQKLAPDGTKVYELIEGERGSLAIFEQNAGDISIAVKHEIVEEIWYVLSGAGQIWTKSREGGAEKIIEMHPGVVMSLPVQTHFQFRNTGLVSLRIAGLTLPSWAHANEPAPEVEGYWSIAQHTISSMTFQSIRSSSDEMLEVLRSNLVI